MKLVIKRIVITILILMVLTVPVAAMDVDTELTDALTLKTDLPLAEWFLVENDSDGTTDAFAAVGEVCGKSERGNTLLNGEVWFVSTNGAKCMMQRGILELYGVFRFGSTCVFVASNHSDTADSVFFFTAQHGEAVQDSISGKGCSFQQIDHRNMILSQSAYDSMQLTEDKTCGHTWKQYYFFWSEPDQCFYEYGGMPLSEETFLSLNGGKQIIDQIGTGGGTIMELLYRDNGIIHINYQIGDNYHNATVSIRDGKAELLQFHEEQGDLLAAAD